MFFTDPSRGNSEGNAVKAGCLSMWGKEASHTDARRLEDFRAGLGNLPEQDPVTIAEADLLGLVSRRRGWTASGPDVVHTHWPKKLTVLQAWQHKSTRR